MRLLYLASDREFGGGQQYFLSIAEVLGDDAECIVGCSPGSSLEKELCTRSIPVIPFSVRSKLDIMAMRRFAREMKGKSYDAVFLGDGAAWNTGKFLKKTTGWNNLVPIVHMTHIGLEQKEYSLPERMLSAFWDRTWSRSARKIVVSNQKNADILVKEKVSPEKITVIPNCVDADLIRSRATTPRAELLRKYQINESDVVIGTISRLGPGKDLRTLLDALPLVLKNYSGCRFVVVGTGPEKSACEEHVRNAGIESRVTFTGWVENQYDYFNLFDVFLFAGISDGIPYVVLESMAFGKPAVATDNGAVNEAIQDGITGVLVKKGSGVAMAEGVMRLLKDASLMHTLGKAAGYQCRSHFSMESMREKIGKMLKIVTTIE